MQQHQQQYNYTCNMDKIQVNKRPQILLIGDSLTQYAVKMGGWAQHLGDWYLHRADILVRGFSGYTTQTVQRALELLFAAELGTIISNAPHVVTLCFGANDSACIESSQHVPLDDYKNNLQKIVQYLQQHLTGMKKLVLITPPPVHQATWDKVSIEKGDKWGYRTCDTTRQYAQAVKSVANQFNLQCVDLWEEFDKNSGSTWAADFYVDGTLCLSIQLHYECAVKL